MSTPLYTKENVAQVKRLASLAEEPFKAYMAFTKEVMKAGALSVKEKEIMAVAVSHATECPYCIDIHTKKAKKEGATLQELAEAVMVTAAIEAGGAATHSVNMQNSYDEEKTDELYKRSSLMKLNELGKMAPDAFQAAMIFFKASTKEGVLSHKLKELIAVAIGHTTECPYCIDIHSKNAKQAGASKEELGEAVLVASTVRAGGAITHASHMMKAFEE